MLLNLSTGSTAPCFQLHEEVVFLFQSYEDKLQIRILLEAQEKFFVQNALRCGKIESEICVTKVRKILMQPVSSWWRVVGLWLDIAR